MTIPMKKTWDCGVVSACNHVATMTGKDPERMYAEMIGSQPRVPVFRDFWDSPTRQQSMIASLSGRPCGLVATNPLLVPCAALVKQKGSWFYAHWITILSVDPSKGIYHWHDGMKERDDLLPWDIEIALAIGGTGKMPLKWRLWGGLTWPIRRIF